MTRLGSLATGEDATVAAIVTEASSAIAAFLGYEPWRQSYELALRGYGLPVLQLPVLPVELGLLTITHQGQDLDELVIDPASGLVSRDGGFPWTAAVDVGGYDLAPGTELPDITATFTAGYVPAEDVLDWSADLVVALGDFVRPPWPNRYLYEVTTAGMMATAAPAWSTTLGAETTSGTTVITTRAAQLMPAALEAAAHAEVSARFQGRRRDPLLASRSVPGLSVAWRESAVSGGTLCPAATAGAQSYRYLGGSL